MNRMKNLTTRSHSEDYLHLNVSELMRELQDLSATYNKWYGLKVDRETELKQVYAKK